MIDGGSDQVSQDDPFAKGLEGEGKIVRILRGQAGSPEHQKSSGFQVGVLPQLVLEGMIGRIGDPESAQGGRRIARIVELNEFSGITHVGFGEPLIDLEVANGGEAGPLVG